MNGIQLDFVSQLRHGCAVKTLLNFAMRLRRRLPDYQHGSIAPFSLTRAEAEQRRSGSNLEDIFFSGNTRLVHKWIDYLPIYDKFFGPRRGTTVRMLEIGVSLGGSLDMWRAYFGPDAIIYGIDIDPACADRVDPPNQVRIGSQDDPAFLRSVVAEMGRPDIVLDDGSHVADHQRASLKYLWPVLMDGGLYLIEDTHTSYWSNFRGGFRRRGTAIEIGKAIVDDMHGWFHNRRTRFMPMDEIGAVHFFESMIVLEKRAKQRPGHVRIKGRS